MKTTLIAIFALIAGLAFTSCEKCTTCTYSYDFGGTIQEFQQAEFCGSNSEVNDYKDALQVTADDAAALIGGTNVTLTCVDD